MRRIHPAVLPLTLTVLAWGFNFVAVKWAYLQISPSAVGLARFFPTLLVMMIVTLLIKEDLKYPREDALKILFNGFLAMGIYMIAFLEGVQRTTAADAAILLASSPMITYALAVLVRQEKFLAGAFLGALVAFAGVALVVFGSVNGQHGKLAGNGLIFLSAVLWALSVVYSRPLVAKYSSVRVFTLSLPGALPVLIPYGLAGVIATPWAHLTLRTWLSFAHISILAGALGFTGFYLGVRRADASGAMLAQFCVPPLAAICAAVFLGERISIQQIVGMAVILLGVWASTHFRRTGVRQLSPESN